MAAVGEHGELDAGRAAVVEQGVDAGAHRAAGEEDVVDEDDGAPVEVEVEVRGVDDRGGGGVTPRQVVAVERDVDVAERDVGAGELADERMEPAGEDRAAGVDADEGDRVARGSAVVAGVLLDDLVRDPHERAAQIVAVEYDPVRACQKRAPSWPLWTGLKEPTGPT